MRLIFVLLLVNWSCTLAAQHRQYLHSNWILKTEDKQTTYDADVPGTVHQDLMKAGVIDDIYFENNEHNYQWIEEKNWHYETTFSVKDEALLSNTQHLVFEGLDTYATIYLNDSLLSKTNNMFRTWRIDVKGLLNAGNNTLRITFQSPITKNKDKFQNSPYVLPAGGETGEIRVSPYTRKAAYNFGWDWGPRVVTCGIWKPIYLEMLDEGAIADIRVTTEAIKNDTAWIRYDVELASINRTTQDKVSVAFQEINQSVNVDQGNTVMFKRKVPKAQLWWPNGYGTPHMYEEHIVLKINDEEVDKKKFRYGIRKIELVTEPDSIGTSFFFKVNGQSIFVKGANYIPQDLLLTRVTDEQYDNLLTKVQEAHMNMIRVWGGGIYEKDIFYDFCDEKGIMVWQDFMFAGSMYPGDSVFLDNVKHEIRDNIKRIRSHPSLAIWCGNNEMEVAWNNWGWQKQFGYSEKDSTEIWNNYLRIFEDIIPNTLNELDPDGNYTSTSPISNWGTPENFNHATMHYWGVWHGRDPFEKFATNVGRFMVEYGFQSFPEISTLEKVMSDSSLYLHSIAMKNRQKSYIGNGLIEKHVLQYFAPPKDFNDFVILSQKTQALGMKMAIQEHRKAMPHCMGTLFWQLNDCWPGPSWSVIDYYGNNKIAYEEIKEQFSPILLIQDSNHQVTLISDLTTPYSGQLVITVQKKNKKEKQLTYPIQLEALSKIQIDVKTYPEVSKLLRKQGEVVAIDFL